jgi:NTE family protein
MLPVALLDLFALCRAAWRRVCDRHAPPEVPRLPAPAKVVRLPAPHATTRKRINLALQGGGAHGAFTWGVLDHLLEDGRTEIDGISGTSAGAMNAVMLADGLDRGGPEEARLRLAEFWRAVSLDGHLSDLQRAVVERLFPFAPREGLWLGAVSRLISPYDLNPLNINPLKDLIERFVDFEGLRRIGGREIFISATNVHTGEIRVFNRAEISAEAVMASACLPLLFRAVEIDGVPYWDGGYSGNPALIPFLHATATEDVLLVQINPREKRKTPTRTRDIMVRVNEITFNAPLLAELRAVNFVNRLIDKGRLSRGLGEGEFRRLKLHRIAMEESTMPAARSGTLNTAYQAFESLHKAGQRTARRFLDAHFDAIGQHSTIDIVGEERLEMAG